MDLKNTIRYKLKKQLNKKNDLIQQKREISNIDFINEYGTQGGVSFKDEKIVKTGDGYEACLFVYKYPIRIDSNWLSVMANRDDTIVTFDISTIDKNKVIRNIDRSMEEQSSRYSTAKSHSERKQSQRKYNEAELMYDEVTIEDDVMKLLVSRIYVSDKTLEGLEEKIATIKTDLDITGYKSAIALNETKEDWKSIFIPYNKQDKLRRKKGQEVLASQLAIGNPFYFSSLDDPAGAYYGTTFANNGGSVFLDLFRKTEQRLSYNTVLFGKPGSGKSTTLKKIFQDRASRGDLVRVFDVTGEYSTLTETFGGKVIALDGSSGQIINALQIRKTDEDMSVCYNNHISMISAIYKTLNKDASTYEVLMMEKILRELYVKLQIVPESGLFTEDITKLDVYEYPIWSDFLEYIKIKKKNLIDINQENTMDYQYICNIELIIERIVDTFGNIFNGYTTITDIYEEQIISFNISKLSNMDSAIFDAQLFIALSLCWDNCISVGLPMKQMWANREIDFDDIRRFIILIDESHKWVNANKIPAVEQVVLYLREARKYFGGICLASQTIRDYVPDEASQKGVDLMRTLFELCTYKFIMQQDINCKSKLADIFSDQITEYELNKVSTLIRGETILMISSDRNLHFQIEITDEEERIFAGGA